MKTGGFYGRKRSSHCQGQWGETGEDSILKFRSRERGNGRSKGRQNLKGEEEAEGSEWEQGCLGIDYMT